MRPRVKQLLLTATTLTMVAIGTPPGAWPQYPSLVSAIFPELSTQAIFSCQNLTVSGNSVDLDIDVGGTVKATAVVTGLGGKGKFTTWDALNRPIAQALPASETTTFGYDDNGNPTSIERPNGGVRTRSYDGANRLVGVTDPLAGTTVYGYDGNDNLVSVTDAAGKTVTLPYDALNRPLTRTYPGGATEIREYDAIGNLTQLTDSNVQVVGSSYDELNRLIHRDYSEPVRPLSEVLSAITIAYDGNANPTSISEIYNTGTRTTSRSYDDFDRLISVTDGFGKTVGYGYDVNGNRTQLSAPDGEVTHYGYGAMLDVLGLTLDAVAIALPVIPGGASAGIKGLRALNAGADLLTTTRRAQQLKRGLDALREVDQTINAALAAERALQYAQEGKHSRSALYTAMALVGLRGSVANSNAALRFGDPPTKTPASAVHPRSSKVRRRTASSSDTAPVTKPKAGITGESQTTTGTSIGETTGTKSARPEMASERMGGFAPGQRLPDGRIAGNGPGAALRNGPEFVQESQRITDPGRMLPPSSRITTDPGRLLPPSSSIITNPSRLLSPAPGGATLREGVLANIAESRAARHSSGFSSHAERTASVKTPHGIAIQDTSSTGLMLRRQVLKGREIFRGGNYPRSLGPEGQYWAFESPLTPGYAQRTGAATLGARPPDFMMSGQLRQGAHFIVRRAPAYGANLGGGWEVVVEAAGVRVNYFVTP